MTEEAFRLPKSSYDELVRIIRAYGSAGKESSLPDLARTAAMHETIISRNNAFLSSVGLIEGGKAKTVTPKGHDLAIALQHEIPEQISSHWRDLSLSNEFLQKMVTAVSIRQGMEPAALQSHIAYSAGEPKKPDVMAGAGAVIDILKIAGLLTEEDGKLVAKKPFASTGVRGTGKEGKEQLTVFHIDEQREKPPAPLVTQSGITIQIQIQCTASDLDDLAPKLRALLKELSKPDKGTEQS